MAHRDDLDPDTTNRLLTGRLGPDDAPPRFREVAVLLQAAHAAAAPSAVGDEALKRGTGARGLRAILEEVLLEVMYDLPSRTDVEKVVIDRGVVLDKVKPTLVPRAAATESTPRPRRAAS